MSVKCRTFAVENTDIFMNTNFEMVAKTFGGLEGVLAEELTALGATDVTPGNRMVSFRGDLAMLYKANMCCRTALRILKPLYSFEAGNADSLYAKVKEFDWSSIMDVNTTFSIDTVAYSDDFRNSQFVTYRVKDGIVDWFRDKYGDSKRPSVRIDGAERIFNVHISGKTVTISLDSSGESLHKRGWRRAQTEAPISEVLAAGIIMLSGWKGDTPFVDPMCGSGTFAIEAAMIAAGIYPGIYRKHFAFEDWPDFDSELLESIYNDDSNEREVNVPIVACDINRQAIDIARANARSAALDKYITFEVKPIEDWSEAPQPGGVLVTNPPYGRRISSDDMDGLYDTIGKVLKHVFTGYHAWIIGYEDVYFHHIGLAPSQKIALNNGGLDCELREYVIFEGRKDAFRAAGGSIKAERAENPTPKERRAQRKARFTRDNERDDRKPRFGRDKDRDGRKPRFGRDKDRDGRKPRFDRDKDRDDRKPRFDRDKDRDDRNKERKGGYERRGDKAASHTRRDDFASRERKERRPLDLSTIGRKPQISAENEIVVNRPAWRVRKKDRPGQSGENDK